MIKSRLLSTHSFGFSIMMPFDHAFGPLEHGYARPGAITVENWLLRFKFLTEVLHHLVQNYRWMLLKVVTGQGEGMQGR